MQEHSFLPEFNDDDVVEFVENNMVKTGRVRETMRSFFNSNIEELLRKHCFDNLKISIPMTQNSNKSRDFFFDKFMGQGVRCKLLKLGSTSWQTGRIKIRVSVEFEPDEPEIKEPLSPLDDIRQTINK